MRSLVGAGFAHKPPMAMHRAVIPAKAGIQAIGLRDQIRRFCASFAAASRIAGVDDEIIRLDSGFRRNDGKSRDGFVCKALGAILIGVMSLWSQTVAAQAVIAAGQDELLATMLGQGESMAGCTFAGGGADGGTVQARYACPAGEVVLKLVHPDAAPRGAVRTDRFGISIERGSPPDGMMAELTARIRQHERAFQWVIIGGSVAAGRVRMVAVACVAILASVLVASLAAPRILRWLLSLVTRVVMLLGGVLVGLLLVEIVVRLSGIERSMIRRSLLLQQADLGVHRVSNDPFLHYELAPDAHLEVRSKTGEPYSVRIDARGARRPTHSRAKSSNTFRILCVGGSTMYGAAVNDEQTLPARLEERLNEQTGGAPRAPMRFEVWNYGTSAYTLGQATHLARTQLTELNPDLIIVQHHNVGRRPYLSTPGSDVAGEPPDLQSPAVDFFLEQFPVPANIPIGWHEKGLRYSALYRSMTALTPYLYENRSWDCSACAEMSAAEARALSLASEARGVPVMYVMIPADLGVGVPAAIFPELTDARFIDLYALGHEAQFYEVHPPAAVLDEYAVLLAAMLRERGLLPPTVLPH